MERAIYGEFSLHVGKTYKLIGTVLALMKNTIEAKEFLGKAAKIFELKKNQKY